MPTGLPVIMPGKAAAVDHLVLVEHPQHVLRGGHHVGGRHVGHRADVARELPHPAAADLLLLAGAQVVGIADHPALAAAQRDVRDGALPGHPHRQGAHRVDGLLGMEADAALAGPRASLCCTRKPRKTFTVPSSMRTGIVKWYSRRGAQQVPRRRVQSEQIGDLVELGLGHLERVECLRRHDMNPLRKEAPFRGRIQRPF